MTEMNQATTAIRFTEPSAESQMLADSAARFIADHYDLAQRKQMLTQTLGAQPAHWGRMADLGWLAAPLPETVGGLGLTPEDLAPLLRQLGAGLVLEPYGPAILHCGTCLAHTLPADVAEEALAPMLAGERIEVLVDATKATTSLTANGWHLKGTARAVTAAAEAAIIWIAAQGPDGPALFRLPADQVRRRPLRLIDGQPAADVSIDVTAELVEATALPEALARAHDIAVFGVLAETSGLISALYEDTLAYAKMREQFGRPIGKFQSIQHRLAEMFILREECLSMTQLAAEALRHEDKALRDRVLSSARIKLADAARTISHDAIQLHGGMGVTDELKVGHRVKRLLVLAQQGGARHHHLARLRN